MAGSLARLPANSEGTPRRPDEESQERAKQAPQTRGTSRPLPGELPQGAGCLRSGRRPVRIRALVEGRWSPGHNRQTGRHPEASKPGGTINARGFPDHEGALSLESGLRPATVQLDNRLRCFALRLASLPRGDQARELIGAAGSALGQRLQSHLGCWNGKEETCLLEVASPLDTSTTIEEAEAAATEAKRTGRPGLCSRTDPG